MVFRRVKKTGRRLFLLLLVCLAVWLWYLWREHREPSRMPVMQTVQAVQTEQSVCAVTMSLTGIESNASLRLLAAVCEGMNLRPCVFVTTDWLHDNPELLPSLAFAELGMLFEDSPERWTEKHTMTAIAEENERFMAMTGTFPRYVRLKEGAPGGHTSTALQAFGQTCIGSSASVSDALSAGSIIDLGLLDGTTGYALAKFCANALANDFEVISLSELLMSAEV